LDNGIGQSGKDNVTNVSPSLIKDLRPVPRPVDVALPPSATAIAVKMALLPPNLRE
jgi:hypothetical protein